MTGCRSHLKLTDPGADASRATAPDRSPVAPSARRTLVCRWCSAPARPTASGLIQSCPRCRSAYLGSSRRYLCHVPDGWSTRAFVRYWERGLGTARHTGHDLAFTRYVCDRVGLDFALAIDLPLEVESMPTPLGELAIDHRLLTPQELEWLLKLERRPPRRYLGEIAIAVGLWSEGLVAPLLAAQAERTRGIVPGIARGLGIASRTILDAEREFFGLYPTITSGAGTPVGALLAAGG